MAREVIEDKIEAEITALKAENAMLKGCVMELADIVYGTDTTESVTGE